MLYDANTERQPKFKVDHYTNTLARLSHTRTHTHNDDNDDDVQ